MLKIRRVLFPTDFSETAEEAFAQAAELARFFSADLLLLHVLDPWQDERYTARRRRGRGGG